MSVRSYSDKDLKLLCMRSGGICAYQGCENELSISAKREVVGQICHIRSFKKKDYRYDPTSNAENINSYENLVLMCSHHHTIIDSESCKLSINDLIEIKQQHEDDIRRRLRVLKRTTIRISQIYYLNLIRYSELASNYRLHKCQFVPSSCKYLSNVPFNFLNDLVNIAASLRDNSIEIVNLSSSLIIDESMNGKVVEFKGRFRTKGMVGPDSLDKFTLSSDHLKNPMIYQKFYDQRIVYTLEPKWVTSTSGFVLLTGTGGNASLYGIGLVKGVIDRDVIITPIIMGYEA